jgi:coenzyme F420-reducing hydrogenase gamma subunit
MAWLCPCQGCKKAVKQEQDRIIDAIEKIDINAPHQINALGLKLLILDIIRPKK